MSVPDFVLARKLLPGGYRLPKREIWDPRKNDPFNLCVYCQKDLGHHDIRFVAHRQWAHRQCFSDKQLEMARQEAQRIENMIQQGNARKIYLPSANTTIEVPSGSLMEEEYRFWIGSREAYSTWGQCRRCGKMAYNTSERRAHSDETPYPNCNTRLVMAYNELLKKRQCLVCQGGSGAKARWGIPLCSQACVEEWKFARRKYLRLEMELRQMSNGGTSVLEST